MSLTAEAAQLSVGDLLEAWSELQAIRSLLSSRSEAGLYAKVEELDNEHADLLAALKAVVAVLQKEAPGTALNHHQYDAIGMQAHAAIAKAEGR